MSQKKKQSQARQPWDTYNFSQLNLKHGRYQFHQPPTTTPWKSDEEIHQNEHPFFLIEMDIVFDNSTTRTVDEIRIFTIFTRLDRQVLAEPIIIEN